MDRFECKAMGHTPESALRAGCDTAKWWYGMLEGQVECAFGICPGEGPNVGVPWYLGTHRVFRGAALRDLLTRGRAFLYEHAITDEHYLVNFVSEQNHKSIRWLKYMGFTIGGTTYFNQHPFLEFSLCVHPQSPLDSSAP